MGIQNFEELRNGGYLYVDKTDIVWRLANGAKYNYLSRPRRFGKSLLVDTLRCYFEGRSGLFSGLKIMEMETAWEKHPVLHFDMSCIGTTASDFQQTLECNIARYETLYQKDAVETSVSSRFAGIIRRAHEQNGQGVVVLIDEYDGPVRDAWGTEEHEVLRNMYRSFLNVLKSESASIRFVFITGIAKFTQLSLFSALNTLENWSFDEKFESLCGLTDEEIDTYFVPELEAMADEMGTTVTRLRRQLKDMYDGYHFSPRLTGVYNPASVIRSLYNRKLANFWASDGASRLLPEALKEGHVDVASLDGMAVPRSVLETSDYVVSNPAIFLYQLGYLTIACAEGLFYYLRMPNTEVRTAFSEIVLPNLVKMESREQSSVINRMVRAFDCCDLETAMVCLKQLVPATPYSNRTLTVDNVLEHHFQFILSTLFSVAGYAVEVERPVASGRIDMVVKTTEYIYVMELKLKQNGGLKAARNQMESRRYADAYGAEFRKVIPLAIVFDADTRSLSEWKQL